jgi:hypothetical protein
MLQFATMIGRISMRYLNSLVSSSEKAVDFRISEDFFKS